MKTGRTVHVPKSNQMKQNYRQYIETLDYQPTVDESLDFKQTNKSGEDLSTVDTERKRPSDPSDKIKEHFAKNWLIWVLCALSAGIGYLVFDSKVAFTRYETILSTQKDKLSDLKNFESDLRKSDRTQDLKIQENRILLNQITNDVSETKTEIYRIKNSQQLNAGDAKKLRP